MWAEPSHNFIVYAKDSIVDYLLRKGADANHECEFFTPIMAVCNSNSFDEEKLANCARSLMQHGANVNSLDKCKTTPLMFACTKGHENLVSILCENKCEVNRFDNDGYSALHLACSGNHFNIVQILLKYGADKYVRDRRGRLPLDIAISKGANDIIQLLDDDQHLPIEETSISYNKKKSNFEELLLQLPDLNSNGKDGFHNDVEILLDGMRLGQKADLFLGKGLSLAKFLNITNEELKKVGLYFSSQRERVIEGNKRFVMHPWGAGSLPELRETNTKPVEIMDIVRSVANFVKHLHIIWATTLYCDERIEATAEDPKAEDLYQILLQTYKQTKSLMRELHLIQEYLEKLENEDKVQHVDLILPKKPGFSLIRKVIFFSAFCAVFAWSKRTLVK
ncbi:Ankyrin repeat, SAM and basic leucine zipper domain-containing protein 1 [Frankliniella fusca]|uniref:Ankyrin repeat, SAM and basic leucine zipper domain-containing protein 1 n=1 Tax=Frankliniella fusca TaxID=407009 RepID=A0AAE1LD94_9NEOP|nr:Ankyrin repeat, SAM and basic leucine zipper domain-containing protein 1 [Frankliniella fusca]